MAAHSLRLLNPEAHRHDDDCGVHTLDPCDCCRAIVLDVVDGFRRDLSTILSNHRKKRS